MLDEQRQIVDIPVHARTAYNGLTQKRLEKNLYWVIHRVPLMTQSVEGQIWTELNQLEPALRVSHIKSLWERNYGRWGLAECRALCW